MSQPELLTFTLAQLKNAQISYLVTESVVSSLQGEPRFTHDIAIVVLPEVKSGGKMAALFPTDVFYLNPDSVAEAIDRRSMFKVIDMLSGNEVDFWLLTDEAYDRSRFDRRLKANVLGITDFYITTPEDTILSKLRWAKLGGGSEKQLTDAARVFEMQFDTLDLAYLNEWIEPLGLHHEWKLLNDRAEPY